MRDVTKMKDELNRHKGHDNMFYNDEKATDLIQNN